MARANNLIPNFTGGEISPRTAARRDVEGFYNSTEYQLNFISDLQGGARFRPGSNIGFLSPGTRLLRWYYDALDNFWVEAGTWLRLLQPDGTPEAMSTGSAYAWTLQGVEKRTNQVVFHVSASSYTNLVTSGMFAFVNTGLAPSWGTLPEEFRYFQRSWLSNDATVTMPYNITSIATSSENPAWQEIVCAYTGATASAFQAVTDIGLYRCAAWKVDYTAEETRQLQYVQRRDAFWIASGSKPVYQIVRTTPGGNVLFSLQFAQIYEKVPGPAVTLTLGATTGASVTATASSSTFVAGDVGKPIMSGLGRGEIIAFTSGTVVTIRIDNAFASTSVAAGTWGIGLNDLVGGPAGSSPDRFPHCVALYEQRLYYANVGRVSGTSGPTTIWGSIIEQFNNFTPPSTPLLATDSIRYDVAFEVGDIVFMIAEQGLLYCQGLDGAVGVDSGSGGTTINATNIRVRVLHNVGSTVGQRFWRYETALYFADRAGQAVYRVQFNYNTEKYQPTMVTLAADHLVKRGIVDVAVKTGDDARIYMVTSRGGIIGHSLSEPYGINAFYRLNPPNGYSFLSVQTLPTTGAQELVGALLRNNTNGYVTFVGFVSDFSSNLSTKDDFYTFVATNEQEAVRDLNGFLFFKQIQLNYLDAALSFTDTLPNGLSLTLGATTGTGVNVNCGTGIFVSADVGRRIWARTAPTTNGRYVGVATITAFVDSNNVTVDIDQDFASTTLGANGWWFEYKTGTILNIANGFWRGSTIDLVLDGVVYPGVAVGNDMRVTLPAPAIIVFAGGKYEGALKTVNMLGVGSLGTSEHLKKNIAYMGVNFFECGQGTSYGTEFFRLEPLDLAQLDDPTDRPPPLFTGEKRIRFDENWNTEKNIWIRHDGGTPCTVLSLIPFFNTSSD